MLVESAGLIPARRHARVVLPFVKELQVLLVLPVHRLEGKVRVEFGDVATVDDGSRVRLRAARRMAGEDGLAVGEFVCDLKVLGHDGIRGQGFLKVVVCAVSHHPDGARAHWRGSTLPEGTPENQQLSLSADDGRSSACGRAASIPPRLWMLDGDAGGEKPVPDDVLPFAGQSESEILVCRVCEVDGVNHVPYRAQGRGADSRPAEDG